MRHPSSSTFVGRCLQGMRKPSTALAIIALVLATAGSATAARTLRGSEILDGSLTGADIKNGSLTLADFSTSSRSLLTGAKGPRGATGTAGIKGNTGATGATGAAGQPARVASKWAWFESKYLRSDAANVTPSNWYEYNMSAPSGASPNGNINLPNLQWTNGLDRSFETVMSLNSPNCNTGDVSGVDCAWGDNDGGGVTVAWDANITAVASINILHAREADEANGDSPHTRVSCYLAANRGTGSSDFDQIGAKGDVSGFRQRQVETLTLVGSINRTTNASTDYMVRVECRDADGTNGINRHYVVGGSMSVVATERG